MNNEKEIAETFNNYFGSIAEKTKSEIPETDKIFTDFLGPANQHSIYMQPTTSQVIAKSIIQLMSLKHQVPTASLLLSSK